MGLCGLSVHIDRKRITVDRQIAAVAANQHGVISLEQLLWLGLTYEAVRGRVRGGRLYPIHRGVYAVGHHGLTDKGRWKAATLAVPDSVLSHRSAAELWGLLRSSAGHVHVSLPYPASARPRQGIRIHRSRTIAATRTTIRDGIPVTMPTRTLADLRRTAEEREWGRAVRQAEYLDLPLDIETDGTRSEPEADFLALCRRHDIPAPEVNQPVGRFTVDFVWREHLLVVEIDGYRAHRGRQAFEDDRQRELELGALGFRVRRFTPAQVAADEIAVAAAVLRALAAA